MGKQTQLDFLTMPEPNPAMIQQLAAEMKAQAAHTEESRQVSKGKAFVGWGVLALLLGFLGVAVVTDNGRKQISEATAGLPLGDFADRLGSMGQGTKIDGVEVDPFYEYVKAGRRTFADNVKVRLFKTYCVDKQGGHTQDEQQICEWASEEFSQILATRQANTYEVKVPK